MNRRLLAVILLIAAILIAGGGILAYILLLTPPGHQPRGRATPTPGIVKSPGGSQPGVQGKGCGITRTHTGYSFSRLHVSGGYLRSEKNCIVDLKGFNWSQLEFGNAVGGAPKTRISEQALAWYNQTFKINVWRFPVNATWWNENVDVPLIGMKYQDWIQQIVQWAEEYGNYVILTKGPQFHYPPCGGDISYCPSQNAAQLGPDVALPQEQTSGRYIDPAITMWTSIARLYADDPAVLYDSWNEMHDLDAQTWSDHSNALIATIRSQNPHSVIFLGGPNFKENLNPLLRGEVPDFAHPNLIYDFHVYDGYRGSYQGKMCSSPLSYIWKNWPTSADEQVGFAQQNGKAVAFSEWGGCYDLADYDQALTSYARTHHICMVYYDETNVAIKTGGEYQLTENGQQVQASYSSY